MKSILTSTSIALLWSIPAFADGLSPIGGTSLTLPVSIANGGTGNTTGQAVSVYGQLNVLAQAYNAVGNGKYLTDGTTTNTQAPICSASYSFQVSDEGKWIAVKGAGNSSGTVSLVEQITGLSAGGAGNCATGATNASKSISGTATIAFGTDDSAHIEAAVTAAAAIGGGLIVLPAGVFIVTAPIQMANNVKFTGQGAGTTIVTAMSNADWPNHGVFYQLTGSTYAAPTFDNTFTRYEIDGGFMNDAVYVVNAKGIDMPFTRRSFIENMYVRDTPATCVATDFGNPTTVDMNVLSGCGRLTGTNGGGNGVGEGTDGGEVEQFNIFGNTISNTHNDPILIETQNSGVNTSCIANIYGNNITQSTAGGTNSAGVVDAGCAGALIESNNIEALSGASVDNCIEVDAGTFSSPVPGVGGLITGNHCSGTVNGIEVNLTGMTGASQSKYSVINNHVLAATGCGLELVPSATYLANTVEFSLNQVAQSGNAGLCVLAGAGGVSNLIVNSDTFMNNGATTATDALKSGISIAAPVANLTMYGVTAFDNLSSKQLYALTVSAAVTGAVIGPDNFQNNATQAIKIEAGGSIAGQIYQVAGYNPVGQSTPSVTASPYTYTCGTSPCTAYVSGGTVSEIQVGSTNTGLTSGMFPLAPNEALVITYSGAPTVIVDVN